MDIGKSIYLVKLKHPTSDTPLLRVFQMNFLITSSQGKGAQQK
jgi:hypothetical protein